MVHAKRLQEVSKKYNKNQHEDWCDNIVIVL